MEKTKHTPTPLATLQIHDLGDNAKTEFDKTYPYLIVAKDDYHRWSEEVPTEEFIIARCQQISEAESLVRAVNSHEALLEAAKLGLKLAALVDSENINTALPPMQMYEQIRQAIDQTEGGTK